MVEITYQMVLSTLQTIGLLVGIAYYLFIMRNSQRNQELALRAQEQSLETRQIQLLWNINQSRSERGNLNWIEVMRMEWTDYDDFMSRYGMENFELYQSRREVWEMMHFQGMLIRDGLLDVETYFKYLGDAPILLWEKFKDIIMEQRRLFQNPHYMIGMEILAEELNKYRISQGWTPKSKDDILYPKTNP